MASTGTTAGAAATEGVFGPARRALTVGIVLAVGAFAAEGMGVVPALPTAVAALSGMELFGWSFSAFMLAWLVGTVAAGQLADARGPHRPMLLGLCGFGAGLLLAATARAMPQFLAGRALQGAGGGAIIAAAYVAIARGYPDALRARMMALTASVWIVPALVGPALSGAIAARASWRWVFAGVVPLLLLSATLVLPPLAPFTRRRASPSPSPPPSPSPSPSPPPSPPSPSPPPSPSRSSSRLPAALRLGAGAALMLAAPSVRGVGGVAGVVGVALALAVGGIGLLLLLPALRALLPAGTLRLRAGLPAGMVARALLAFAFFGTEAFVPLAAGSLRGATPARAGLALTAGAFGWISASVVQDRIEARDGAAGRVGRCGVGFVLLALGILAVAATLLSSLPLLLAPLAWGVAGAGCGLAYGGGSLICIAAAPTGREGEVSGQLQLAEALGTAAGAGVGGALLTALGPTGPLARTPREALGAVFVLTLGAALAGATLVPRLGAIAKADRDVGV